jgi:hypothetical protein
VFFLKISKIVQKTIFARQKFGLGCEFHSPDFHFSQTYTLNVNDSRFDGCLLAAAIQGCCVVNRPAISFCPSYQSNQSTPPHNATQSSPIHFGNN